MLCQPNASFSVIASCLAKRHFCAPGFASATSRAVETGFTSTSCSAIERSYGCSCMASSGILPRVRSSGRSIPLSGTRGVR